MFGTDKRWLLLECFEVCLFFFFKALRLTKFENLCLYELPDIECCPYLGTKNKSSTLLAGMDC